MIGQSLINVDSGGRGRASGIVAALGLLTFILFFFGLIEIIPVAALVGVMFTVVIGTFAWSSFDIINKIPKGDAFVLVLVSGLNIIFDLAIAVIAGIIVSALMFSWDNARRIHLRISGNKNGVKVYEVWGPLFFGSITDFMSRFDVKSDPKKVEIEFKDSRVCDHLAIECIEKLVKKYEKAGKEVYLKHLSDDCKAILTKSNSRFAEHFVLSDGTDKKMH
jgi:SulP family sulfate permease